MIELINNLQKENKELKAELAKYDPFYFCSIAGCEGATLDCWKTCPDSVYNKTKIEAYKEFAARVLENIQDSQDLGPGYLTPKTLVSFIIDDTLDELESEL